LFVFSLKDSVHTVQNT